LSASLELEIKYLLTQEESLETVIEQVIQTVENEGDDLSYDQVLTLCKFLWNAHAHARLVQFIFKHWHSQDFKIPWPYLLGALSGKITIETAELMWENIKKEASESFASKSMALDDFYPQLKQFRADIKLERIKQISSQKEDLLNQLDTFRIQKMAEQERNLLQRLMRLYPDDATIVRQSSDFKERNALDIIARHAPLRRAVILDKEIPTEDMLRAQQSWGQTFLAAAVKGNNTQAFEFAVAAFMMGLFEVSLKILDLTEKSAAKTWLRLEILLQGRRYLDLLQEAAAVEIQYAHDPETFFATAYYRAQAFWGLGQKHSAIEVMEGLLAARPHYRMGLTLLNQWRGQ
jgi:hypothetical protein